MGKVFFCSWASAVPAPLGTPTEKEENASHLEVELRIPVLAFSELNEPRENILCICKRGASPQDRSLSWFGAEGISIKKGGGGLRNCPSDGAAVLNGFLR